MGRRVLRFCLKLCQTFEMPQVSIKLKTLHPSWANIRKRTRLALAEADPDFWHQYLNFTDELYAVIQLRKEIPKTIIDGDINSNTDELHIIVRQKKYKLDVLKFIEKTIQKHYMHKLVQVVVTETPSA